MSIQVHLNKIRNAIYGREVRESIAKGIETAYDDATEKDNANMEVKIARGTHPNLRSRLEEVDDKQQQTTAQLAQTERELESKLSQKVGLGKKAELEDLSSNVLSAIEGGGGTEFNLLSEPQDNSVTARKLNDVKSYPTSINLFDKDNLLVDGYYSEKTGQWTATTEFDSSNFIEVSPQKRYRKTRDWTTYAFWSESGNFISGLATAEVIVAPINAKHVTFSIPKGNSNDIVFTLEEDWTDSYVPYIEGYHLGNTWKVSDNSQSPTKLFGVKEVPASVNLFNKDDVLYGGFFQAVTGKWITNNEFNSTGFIPIKENTAYRKPEFWSEFAFWASDKKTFIEGWGDSYGFTTPPNAKYVTMSLPKESITKERLSTLIVTKESDWVGHVTWESTYVPYKKGYSLDESWLVGKSEDSQRKVDTSDLFLRVPTPYHDGSTDAWANHQATHPSIVQFEEPWNGFKYWMAFTPYPHNQEALENPCVIGSNDGVKWVQPKGFVNPLYPKPVNGYNSDTHLFYNSATGRLEMWWREVTNSPLPNNETLIRRTTANGVTWTEPEEMINESHESWALDLVAPSIIFQNGLYKMWFMRQSPAFAHHLMYMTSPDGKNWSEPVYVKTGTQNLFTWHTNVVLHDGILHLFNHDSVQGRTIKYATSTLGSETEFTAQKTIIQGASEPWALDGGSLYQATPIFTDYGVMVIYGAKSQQGDYALKIQSGESFDSLKPVPAKAFDFYDAW